MRSFRGSSLSLSVLYILTTVYPMQCQLPADCKADRREGMGLYLFDERSKGIDGNAEARGSQEWQQVTDEAWCCKKCAAASDCIAYQYNHMQNKCWTATDAGTAFPTTDSVVSYLKPDKFKHYTVTLKTGDAGSTNYKYMQCSGENGNKTRQSTWMANEDTAGMEFKAGGVDVFNFYLEHVGKLVSLAVNACYYAGEPWNLTSVVIEIDGDPSPTAYSFYFDKLFPGHKAHGECTVHNASSQVLTPSTTYKQTLTISGGVDRFKDSQRRSEEADEESGLESWVIALISSGTLLMLVLMALALVVTNLKRGNAAKKSGGTDWDKAPLPPPPADIGQWTCSAKKRLTPSSPMTNRPYRN